MTFNVSFSIVARHHINSMRKMGIRVIEFDLSQMNTIYWQTRPAVFVHPLFHLFYLQKNNDISRFLKIKERTSMLVGLDVADSDQISYTAVKFANNFDCIVLPSEHAKRTYLSSGVNTKIVVVPHGVSDIFLQDETPEYSRLLDLMTKIRSSSKVVFGTMVRHSEYRKGLDLVTSFFEEIKKHIPNSSLVVLSSSYAPKSNEPNIFYVTEYLNESDLVFFYDNIDIFLMFSRGGGFEIPALESISRLTPVIAAKGWSWDEYLPEYCLVDSHRCKYVLPKNPIHIGGGVEIEIDKAVDKALDMINNLDDYKARLMQYRESVIKTKYNWDAVTSRLVNSVLGV